MIESYVDFVTDSCLDNATKLANEQIKRMQDGRWTMIQCQLIDAPSLYSYSLVYQKTKEEIINKPLIDSVENTFE